MVALGDWLGGASGGIFGIVKNAGIIFVALLVVGLCAWAVYYLGFKKKKWNLDVEVKIPRSDGKLTFAEWGKGFYDSQKGCVHIKRPKRKAVPMKPFDPKRYVQGERILTVIQVAPEQYVPVAHESYEEVIDSTTGEEAIVMELTADLSQSKAWARTFERDAKATYSIMNLLMKYAPFIGIGIILFMNFAGFAILYSKVT